MTEKEMLMDIKPLTTRALIINSDHNFTNGYKILLLKKEDSNKHITYTFPGGHIQEGEYTIDGLGREIEEETGLDTSGPIAKWDCVNLYKEVFRHYKIDKKQLERGNGIMAWFIGDCDPRAELKDTYYEHEKWVTPVWVSLAEFLKIKDKDIKPSFIKPYVLECIGCEPVESKWIEEVYTC